MSAHRVSPVLSLQAVFRKKLASHVGKNDISDAAGKLLSKIASSILLSAAAVSERWWLKAGRQLVLSWWKWVSVCHSIFSEE